MASTGHLFCTKPQVHVNICIQSCAPTVASSVYHLSELVLITHTNYAIGGERTTHYYKVVENYNPTSNTWTQIPDILMASSQAGACTLDGKLHVQESLSFSEKDTRLKNLHHSLRIGKQQVHRLKAKIGQLLENEEVSPQTMMAPTCLTSSLSVVHPLTKDTQQSLHSEVQKYNSLRDKRQMKWHPLVICFALNLKYMSTSAYRAVHQQWRHQSTISVNSL